jgi:hypothetical protein
MQCLSNQAETRRLRDDRPRVGLAMIPMTHILRQSLKPFEAEARLNVI